MPHLKGAFIFHCVEVDINDGFVGFGEVHMGGVFCRSIFFTDYSGKIKGRLLSVLDSDHLSIYLSLVLNHPHAPPHETYVTHKINYHLLGSQKFRCVIWWISLSLCHISNLSSDSSILVTTE